MAGTDSTDLPGTASSGYPGEVDAGRSPVGPVAAALGVAAGVAALRARRTPASRSTQARRTASAARTRASRAPRQVARAGRAAGSTTTSALRRPPRAVATTAGAVGHRAQHAADTWSRTMRRILLAAVTATGYVLGTRAGRERYDELVGKARELLDRPEVKPIKDKLDQATKGGQGQHEATAPEPVLVTSAEPYPSPTAPAADPLPRPVP